MELRLLTRRCHRCAALFVRDTSNELQISAVRWKLVQEHRQIHDLGVSASADMKGRTDNIHTDREKI